MTSDRKNHTATTLVDGRVLITGGTDGVSTTSLSSAEIYDPATGSFTATGPMASKRATHTATRLLDGRVLITGGSDGVAPLSLSSVEIYDPLTGIFTATGPMTEGRIFHTATRLPDGKVLITGGNNSTAYNAIPRATTELFDPTAGANGSFAATGSMASARARHTATLLNDGTVLVTGGQSGGTANTTLATAQIYNPATGSFFAEIGPLSVGRRLQAATLLNDGRVLLTGGYGYSVTSSILSSAEIFNPTGSGSGTFSATAAMTSGRLNHTATRLLNGKVLIAGGYDGSIDLATAQLFNPAAGSFVDAGTMYSARAFHVAALLNNGMVVISGGSGTSYAPSSSELYDPVAIKVAPVAYTFPDAYVSDQSIPQSFTISNFGLVDFTLNSIGFSGTDGSMFTLSTDSCGPLPHTLAANGGNCSIIVNFIPSSGGVKSASLDITSSDPEKPVLSAALSGTGLTVALTIHFAGTGAGSTTSAQEGLTCQSSSGVPCQAQVGPGAEITVYATGDKDSLFAGWPDDCIANGSNGCTILVFSDTTVTASYNYIEPARINSTY